MQKFKYHNTVWAVLDTYLYDTEEEYHYGQAMDVMDEIASRYRKNAVIRWPGKLRPRASGGANISFYNTGFDPAAVTPTINVDDEDLTEEQLGWLRACFEAISDIHAEKVHMHRWIGQLTALIGQYPEPEAKMEELLGSRIMGWLYRNGLDKGRCLIVSYENRDDGSWPEAMESFKKTYSDVLDRLHKRILKQSLLNL